MAFLHALLGGLAALGRWDVLLLVAAYGAYSTAVTMAPLYLWGADRDDTTFSSTFNMALLRAMGASIASVFLVIVMLGGPTLEVLGEATRTAPLMIATNAAVALFAALGRLQSPYLGRLLAESSLIPFAAGVVTTARLAGTFLPQLYPQTPAVPLPGLLLLLGFFVVGEALSRLSFVGVLFGVGWLTGYRNNDMMDMPIPVFILALLLFNIASLTPVLIYLAYARLALAQPPGWY